MTVILAGSNACNELRISHPIAVIVRFDKQKNQHGFAADGGRHVLIVSGKHSRLIEKRALTV
ncbi:protein of unknown function [Methylocaldum szegediense]|uniref:Uncharacterized protein n=1 Tax=Methylocaldum szegediense TaxID=73780 RepID=A0ABM9I5P2_9GAMM|nr:protein of unknown function [Methylocaldum szegediense]